MKTKFNSHIAAGITTFLRDDSLFCLIKSFQEYYPEIKLYIVDQGIESTKKNNIYTALLEEGHCIKYISYNCGISKARKILKEIVAEPYLLYAQDDFEITEKANIYKLLDIITHDKSLGVIGGQCKNTGRNKLESYNYFFAKANKTLLYVPTNYYLNLGLLKWQEINDIKYYYSDIIADYSLWRKEIPSDIFDENIHQIEHTFIYLKLKYETNWKVGFCPDCVVEHYHTNTNIKYKKERTGQIKRQKDLDYIYRYWNINKMVYLDKTNILPNTKEAGSNPLTPIITIPKKATPIIRHDIPAIKPPAFSKVDSKIVENILTKIYYNSIEFVIINHSCLDTIRYKKLDLNSDILEIAVSNRENLKKIMELLTKEEKEKIAISIIAFKKTKNTELYGLKVKVPFPVVAYLINLYGENWRNV